MSKTFDFSFKFQVPEEGVSGITEECFRQTVLTYDGDYQWVQYGLDKNNRTAFEAQRTTEGTTPAGATWTKVLLKDKPSVFCTFLENKTS